MTLPFMVGEFGLCKQLSIVLGDSIGCHDRWEGLISSGCRTGVEFSSAWNLVKSEGSQVANFLDMELDTPISETAENAGLGCVDGSTRHQMVEQREGLRASLLSKSLEMHPDQSARPVWVFPQFDKLSSPWILSLPGPETGLTSPVFREALATRLCLPSPACAERVGQQIVGPGSPIVDVFGDTVNCCSRIPGDSWRIKHDTIKKVLMDLAI